MPARLPGRALLVAIFVLGVAALAWIYGQRLNYPPIRSDGLGYYLYLPAVFIDHDITLAVTAARSFGGRIPDSAGVSDAPETGRLLIKYPPGEAVLLAPFFLIAHAATLATGSAPADGFSWPYQTAAAAGGLAYLLLGLDAMRRLLAASFSPPVVRWTLIGMVFGTNLFHYGTYDSSLSHVFSFCLFAWFLLAIERWYSHPAWRSTAILAVLAGLMTLVRPTNSVVFVYALLFGLTDRASLGERLRLLRRQAPLILTGALIYAAVVSPQFLYWKFITGHWVVFSYEGEAFYFNNPRLFNVLFSVRKGLLFWSPILILAVAGFATLKKHKPASLLPILVFMPLNLYVIASWHNWAYGGSFGHRAFVESVPLFALGYASLLESARPSVRRALIVLSAILVALSAQLMVKYWLGIVPYDRTTWEQFLAALMRW
jgi:hypothetical protein